VLSRRRTRFGALILEDRSQVVASGQAAAALAEAVKTRWQALPWTEPARQLQARAQQMRALEPGMPDLSDQALQDNVSDWLEPALHGMTRLSDLAGLDLGRLLRDRLGWEWAQRLDRDVPSHITLPGGRVAIDYAEAVPVASARAQWFYGMIQAPVLAQGRLPLRFALLSPAGRPIAVTADLAGFWRGAWQDVRKDMRGRYPKHDWPERPDL
jgi:ATP-dependent helicase HrpB